MLANTNRLKDLILCSAALGTSPAAKWSILWRQTKNFRVRLGLGSYHPNQVYPLDTVYGRLYFRDNFGDVTNLMKVIGKGEYRVRTLSQPGVILDIGANIGMAAVWLSHFNPRRPIHCFEPLADNVVMIQRNCPEAHVHHVALGRTRSRISLHVDNHNNIASSIPCPWETREVEFDVIPLDEFTTTEHIDRVALLKIDAEGMEQDILDGGQATLAITRQLVMETHGRECHDSVTKFLGVERFTVDSESFSGSTGLVFASRTVSF
jgi:FkbM family methyltransferase